MFYTKIFLLIEYKININYVPTYRQHFYILLKII